MRVPGGGAQPGAHWRECGLATAGAQAHGGGKEHRRGARRREYEHTTTRIRAHGTSTRPLDGSPEGPWARATAAGSRRSRLGHERGRALSAPRGGCRRHCEGVIGATRGLSTTPRGGYWRHEGVVDIVRGLSTPRGGYNARSCQQRASVRTTRAHANNARRRSSTPQRAAPIAPISTSIRQRRPRSPPRTGRPGPAARAGPPRPMSHTREGIRKHSAAHKGRIKSLCAAHVA